VKKIFSRVVLKSAEYDALLTSHAAEVKAARVAGWEAGRKVKIGFYQWITLRRDSSVRDPGPIMFGMIPSEGGSSPEQHEVRCTQRVTATEAVKSATRTGGLDESAKNFLKEIGLL